MYLSIYPSILSQSFFNISDIQSVCQPYQMHAKRIQWQKQQLNHRIKEIIENQYNLSKQSLILYYYSNYWEAVLLSQDWSTLRELYMDFCLIDAIKIRVILDIQWPKLIKLKMGSNLINSTGAKILSKCSLPNLKFLGLGISAIIIEKCQIGNEGLRNLIKGKWVHLNELHIYGNKVNYEGLLGIKEGYWPLKQFSIFGLCFGNIISDPISIVGLTCMESNKVSIIRNVGNKKIQEQLELIWKNRR